MHTKNNEPIKLNVFLQHNLYINMTGELLNLRYLYITILLLHEDLVVAGNINQTNKIYVL